MDTTRGNILDFGMDTITPSGSLPAKLAAVRAAGVTPIILPARDRAGCMVNREPGAASGGQSVGLGKVHVDRGREQAPARGVDHLQRP